MEEGACLGVPDAGLVVAARGDEFRATFCEFERVNHVEAVPSAQEAFFGY